MNTDTRLGRLSFWLRKRDLRYLARRATKLAGRYGIWSRKAKRRTLAFVELLAEYRCAPTLAVPGRVVRKHVGFMRVLNEAGVELAVHGYDHVDFRSLSAEASREQFARAMKAYADAGIPFRGFRCPYLSFDHDMIAGVPAGAFRYSSNEAVRWDTVLAGTAAANVIFARLGEFYGAERAADTLVVPRRVGGLVEIPVSLPDDLQLLDGLDAGDVGVRDAWIEILAQAHRLGAIFVVLFHPESFYSCEEALRGLLERARALRPAVWIARLQEVADWWMELASFSARSDDATVELVCSERATVLVRGLESVDGTQPFDERYRRASARTLRFDPAARPFVGLGGEASPETLATLQGLGYLVETGEGARSCATFLEASTIARFESEPQLVAYIESLTTPLVRYGSWPDGARSALSITGDLDALSLIDYVGRLVTL
jgi:predicted deacetylase